MDENKRGLLLLLNRPLDFVTKRKKVAVRLLGVDTPELRDKRSDFKAAAVLARDEVNKWLNAEKVIFLSLDKPDKYGRALGDFQRADGSRLSGFLLENAQPIFNKIFQKMTKFEDFRDRMEFFMSPFQL